MDEETKAETTVDEIPVGKLKFNGPHPVSEDATESSVIFNTKTTEKKDAKQLKIELGQKKRQERQNKKREEKRSEEFNTALLRSVSASENGSIIRKLFTKGELIEQGESNRYTEEEKEETKKRMLQMAERIALLSAPKSTPVVQNLEPTVPEVEVQPLPDADINTNVQASVSLPLPKKKKKLWDI